MSFELPTLIQLTYELVRYPMSQGTDIPTLHRTSSTHNFVPIWREYRRPKSGYATSSDLGFDLQTTTADIPNAQNTVVIASRDISAIWTERNRHEVGGPIPLPSL